MDDGAAGRVMGDAGELGHLIPPVQHESTVDLIAARLRTAVFTGTLVAGAPLREIDLAAQLGVSRGPLREAAQRLVAERTLTARRRGLWVPALTADDAADVLAARADLEAVACRRIIASGSSARQAALRALRRCEQRLAKATAKSDHHVMADAEVTFHRTLVELTGSPRLSAMLEPLLVETRLCARAAHAAPEMVETDGSGHATVLVALRAGDVDACRDALAHHFDEIANRINSGD